MVRLVQPLIADGVVFPAVDPVDAVIREDKEALNEDELNRPPRQLWRILTKI